MRYAVSFQLQNMTKDLSRLSLPTLSDISHGIVLEMKHVHYYHTPAREALNKLLHATDAYRDWVPEQGPELLYDNRLNRHLGDNGIISQAESRTSTEHEYSSPPFNTRPA